MGYAVNYVEAKITSLAVHGFLLNKEKSIWDPAQNIIRLGTVINTSECLISATDSKDTGFIVSFGVEGLPFSGSGARQCV